MNLITLGSAFGNIRFTLFQAPELTLTWPLVVTAFAVALTAILETMLSAKIADGMTHTKHDERREMLGLGLANIASGLAGGIPATAALARTSLNIKTGATSKASATISSLSLIVISACGLGECVRDRCGVTLLGLDTPVPQGVLSFGKHHPAVPHA